MKLTIGFDIDGCFVDIMFQVRKRLDEHGIAILNNGMYHIQTLPALSVDELWGHFIACYADYENVPIFPGAHDLCEMLYRMSGCALHFITTRPSAYAHLTCKTLDRFCKVPYSVAHVTPGLSKANYLNGQTHFVEDRRKTAKEIAATGRTVYVPRRDWNFMLDQPGIIKIDGIHELIPLADEFIDYN